MQPRPPCFPAPTRAALGVAGALSSLLHFLLWSLGRWVTPACGPGGQATCPAGDSGGAPLPSHSYQTLLLSCLVHTCSPPPQMVLPPRLSTFQTLRSCGPTKLSASGGRRDIPGPTPSPVCRTCATVSSRKTRRQYSVAWSTMTPATPLCCDVAT